MGVAMQTTQACPRRDPSLVPSHSTGLLENQGAWVSFRLPDDHGRFGNLSCTAHLHVSGLPAKGAGFYQVRMCPNMRQNQGIFSPSMQSWCLLLAE